MESAVHPASFPGGQHGDVEETLKGAREKRLEREIADGCLNGGLVWSPREGTTRHKCDVAEDSKGTKVV